MLQSGDQEGGHGGAGGGAEKCADSGYRVVPTGLGKGPDMPGEVSPAGLALSSSS